MTEEFYKRVPKYLKPLMICPDLKNAKPHQLKEPEDFGTKEQDINYIRRVASDHVMSKLAPMSDMFTQKCTTFRPRITFGCKSMDRITAGGILTGCITELYGDKGSGKTHIVLQLCLTVQLPRTLGGLDRGVIVISSDGKFQSKRLVQIADGFFKRYPGCDVKYLNRIFLHNINTKEKLFNYIEDTMYKFMNKEEIGLIIIDSLSGILMANEDDPPNDWDIRKFMSNLLRLATHHRCGIVCVNQSKPSPNNQLKFCEEPWANLGRIKFRVSKIPKLYKVDEKYITGRKLEITFSSETPNDSCEFIITTGGVIDCPKGSL